MKGLRVDLIDFKREAEKLWLRCDLSGAGHWGIRPYVGQILVLKSCAVLAGREKAKELQVYSDIFRNALRTDIGGYMIIYLRDYFGAELGDKSDYSRKAASIKDAIAAFKSARDGFQKTREAFESEKRTYGEAQGVVSMGNKEVRAARQKMEIAQQKLEGVLAHTYNMKLDELEEYKNENEPTTRTKMDQLPERKWTNYPNGLS